MNEDRDTNTAADLEPDNQDASDAALQNGQFNQAVCIAVHSVRKRLADPDGISAKAAIDAIVAAGVLQDDSAKFVKEVRFTQEKGSEEKTIIVIEAAE